MTNLRSKSRAVDIDSLLARQCRCLRAICLQQFAGEKAAIIAKRAEFATLSAEDRVTSLYFGMFGSMVMSAGWFSFVVFPWSYECYAKQLGECFVFMLPAIRNKLRKPRCVISSIAAGALVWQQTLKISRKPETATRTFCTRVILPQLRMRSLRRYMQVMMSQHAATHTHLAGRKPCNFCKSKFACSRSEQFWESATAQFSECVVVNKHLQTSAAQRSQNIQFSVFAWTILLHQSGLEWLCSYGTSTRALQS